MSTKIVRSSGVANAPLSETEQLVAQSLLDLESIADLKTELRSLQISSGESQTDMGGTTGSRRKRMMNVKGKRRLPRIGWTRQLDSRGASSNDCNWQRASTDQGSYSLAAPLFPYPFSSTSLRPSSHLHRPHFILHSSTSNAPNFSRIFVLRLQPRKSTSREERRPLSSSSPHLNSRLSTESSKGLYQIPAVDRDLHAGQKDVEMTVGRRQTSKGQRCRGQSSEQRDRRQQHEA